MWDSKIRKKISSIAKYFDQLEKFQPICAQISLLCTLSAVTEILQSYYNTLLYTESEMQIVKMVRHYKYYGCDGSWGHAWSEFHIYGLT